MAKNDIRLLDDLPTTWLIANVLKTPGMGEKENASTALFVIRNPSKILAVVYMPVTSLNWEFPQ